MTMITKDEAKKEMKEAVELLVDGKIDKEECDRIIREALNNSLFARKD